VIRTHDDLPLAGLRVLDLVEGTMGAVARTLAEWGATVVRIEPRAGGTDRRAGARIGEIALGFATANLGKASMTLDLDYQADRSEFERLASTADILIEDSRLRRRGAWSADIGALRGANPGLVVLSLSGFGANTSFSDWHATDPVLHAMSGELSRSGLPEREPLLPPGELAARTVLVSRCTVTRISAHQ